MERKANRYYVYSDERQGHIKEIKKEHRMERFVICLIVSMYLAGGFAIWWDYLRRENRKKTDNKDRVEETRIKETSRDGGFFLK